MKRTSVRYEVTSSYSHNSESETASRNVRRNSCLVLTVGILLVIGILAFIFKHVEAGLLLSAIVPGNPFNEGQNDDDAWRIILGIIAVIVLALLPFTLF
jgi:hypothetical protein